MSSSVFVPVGHGNVPSAKKNDGFATIHIPEGSWGITRSPNTSSFSGATVTASQTDLPTSIPTDTSNSSSTTVATSHSTTDKIVFTSLDNPTSSSSTLLATPSQGPVQSQSISSRKTAGTGIIIGAVVGSIIFMILLGALIVLLRRRRGWLHTKTHRPNADTASLVPYPVTSEVAPTGIFASRDKESPSGTVNGPPSVDGPISRDVLRLHNQVELLRQEIVNLQQTRRDSLTSPPDYFTDNSDNQV